jgi:hypothetical protein
LVKDSSEESHIAPVSNDLKIISKDKTKGKMVNGSFVSLHE